LGRWWDGDFERRHYGYRKYYRIFWLSTTRSLLFDAFNKVGTIRLSIAATIDSSCILIYSTLTASPALSLQ